MRPYTARVILGGCAAVRFRNHAVALGIRAIAVRYFSPIFTDINQTLNLMTRNIIATVILALSPLLAMPQAVDERVAYDTNLTSPQKPDADKVIGNLINSQDWLALDKALDEMGGDIRR